MRVDPLLQRIQGEFLEMPGLRLSASQGQRLWGLAPDVCENLLHTLVEGGFLSLTRDGLYSRQEGARPLKLTA